MPRAPDYPLARRFGAEMGGLGLQEQVFRFLRDAIAAGRLAPGRRLPPSRRFAAEQGLARQTVTVAYERLAAEGFVVARQGAGTFVADTLPSR
ncbi:MAG TPA: winged helix-turn-helix domain-containing protein, partial [Kiloniellales bacterium]|nr:winged helix-turn-helix domain-containing protein [Kiloniellales bacterium]